MTAVGSARGRRRLALGAAVGVVLAAYGIVAPGARRALPPDVVATVNGVPIRAAEYRRAVADVAADRRDGHADPELRRHVLDRLIEQELLVQRGLALGLARTDRRVRGELTAAVIGAVLAETGRGPSEDEVAAYYAEHPEDFRAPGRVQVEQVFFAEGREADAERARRRLDAGEAFADVRAAGDPEPVPIPHAPLPPARLADYLGSTVARAALALPAGAVAGPLRSGWGYHLVRVTGREETAVPPLAETREQVRAELRRRAGDRRLREYVDALRAAGEVVVRETLP
jgi:hypothetical protein